MKLLSIHPATPVTEGPQAGFPLVFDFWSVEPKPPRERTEVVVRYDESGLQFSFRCLDALPGQARAAATRRGDPDLWQDDGIEIYVDPAGGAGGFRKFSFNIKGVQAECRQLADKSLDPAGPGEGWSVAVKNRADGWDAEVKLPSEVLGAQPHGGALWRFAICRFAHAGERRSATSSPRASHGRPEAFGYLYCADAAHSLGAEHVAAALAGGRFDDGLLLPIGRRAVTTRNGRVETGDLPPILDSIANDLRSRLEACRHASEKNDATRKTWTGLSAQAQRLFSDPDAEIRAAGVIHALGLLPRIDDLELRLGMEKARPIVEPSVILGHTADLRFIGQDVFEMRPGELWLFTHYGRPPTHFAGNTGQFNDPLVLKSRDGGRTWGEPAPMGLPWSIDGFMSDGGKTLFRARSGKVLFITHRNGTKYRHCGSHGLAAISESLDDGLTWSPARLLTDEPEDIQYLMNQRLIQLTSGRLVLTTCARDPRFPLENFWEGVHPTIGLCYLSDDDGRTWRRSRGFVQQLTERGVQEPVIGEYAPDCLVMIYRSGLGCHQASFSDDGGDTWSVPENTSLTAACSPLTMTKLADGRLFLVYNHAVPLFKESYYPRNPLVYATSRDGRVWSEPVLIDDQPGKQLIYPSITPTAEGLLVVYSANYDAGDGGFRIPPDAWKTGGVKRCVVPFPA